MNESLLTHTELVYRAHPALESFAGWPRDVRPQPVTPLSRPAHDLMLHDDALRSARYPDLLHAILRAGDHVHWRETYKPGARNTEFMDRWGCFAVVGEGAPYLSDDLRLFVVYMPAGLYYPPHRHPAEELYLVVAGRAVFKRSGEADTLLSEGDTAFHASQQAHALQTTDSPVLCLVAWRNHLDVPPELLDDSALSAAV